jgi:hypothetical protein
VNPSLFGAIVIVAALVIAAAVWWLWRDITPPKPPGRHRPTRRDPHDPIRRDDEPPPDQP